MLYLSNISKQQNAKTMENATKTTKYEFAMQMVIMDAMEKGHTNKQYLIKYMKSEVFKKSVQSYVDMM